MSLAQTSTSRGQFRRNATPGRRGDFVEIAPDVGSRDFFVEIALGGAFKIREQYRRRSGDLCSRGERAVVNDLMIRQIKLRRDRPI